MTGGTSKRAGGKIPPALCMLKNALPVFPTRFDIARHSRVFSTHLSRVSRKVDKVESDHIIREHRPAARRTRCWTFDAKSCMMRQLL